MPEGDTIHRAAARMERALAGKRITGAAIVDGADALVGREVRSVEARGKNLLVAFDDIWILHTHMRMTGSWHLYRPAERWLLPRRRAKVLLEVADVVAVCFDAPIVTLLRARDAPRVPGLATLGPDLLAPDFDEARALALLRAEGDTPLGVAILLQRVVAGVGNIWKSETLFARRADPFARVSAYDDEELLAILRTARALLQESVAGATRTFGETRAPCVYRRRGRPCRRCGTEIAMRRQGELARSTYYCPRCQPAR